MLSVTHLLSSGIPSHYPSETLRPSVHSSTAWNHFILIPSSPNLLHPATAHTSDSYCWGCDYLLSCCMDHRDFRCYIFCSFGFYIRALNYPVLYNFRHCSLSVSYIKDYDNNDEALLDCVARYKFLYLCSYRIRIFQESYSPTYLCMYVCIIV